VGTGVIDLAPTATTAVLTIASLVNIVFVEKSDDLIKLI
jgi:hypothetical protein